MPTMVFSSVKVANFFVLSNPVRSSEQKGAELGAFWREACWKKGSERQKGHRRTVYGRHVEKLRKAALFATISFQKRTKTQTGMEN